MGHIFYDLETSDLDRNFGQILQIGLIYTDDDLNEIERKEIRARRNPWVVPSPGALLTTGFTDDDLEKQPGSLFDLVHELKDWLDKKDWPLTFWGYNSLRFDEPVLQNALHQNLEEPFLTSSAKKWGEERNTKSDVLTLVKAVHIYAPGVLKLEEKTSFGTAAISLLKVCAQNGIDLSDEAAHDAMADIEATVAVARKLKKEAPEIWDQMLKMRSKDGVEGFLKNNPVFAYSHAPQRGSFVSENIMVSAVAQNPVYANEHIVFDLRFDPADYLDKSADEIAEMMKTQDEEHWKQPFHPLRKNQQPVLMPQNLAGPVMPDDLDEETLKMRAKMIHSNPDFQKRVAEAAKKARPVYDNGTEPEQQIFDFVGKAHSRDVKLWMDGFKNGDWEQREKLIGEFPKRFEEALKDQPSIGRFLTFARRIVFADAPETMEDAARKKYAEALYKRLTTTDDVPWMTLPKARAELDAIAEERKNDPNSRWKDKTEEQIAGLRSYYDKLETRLKAAALGKAPLNRDDLGNDNGRADARRGNRPRRPGM